MTCDAGRPVADLPALAEMRVPSMIANGTDSGVAVSSNSRRDRPARKLHPERVHERGNELDRHAAANAVVAGSVRRAFMRGVR